MARILVIFFGLLVFQQSSTRSLPEEESVVSVYTTQATTSHHQLDVYHQIANNIAERITSPIYRFLGIGKNKTESTTKVPWHKMEILDNGEETFKSDPKPVNNDISQDKDVEELSAEALKKMQSKPEKLTLFSSYLPSNSARVEANDTINEVNDEDDDIESFGFEDDDDEDDKNGRGSTFIYFIEVVASFFRLIYEGASVLFSSSSKGSS